MNTPVPRQEIAHRVETFQSRLRDAGLDAALLVQAVDIFYFTGTRQNSALWVPADGAPVLLVRKSYQRARIETTADARPFPASKDLASVLGADARKIGLTFDVIPLQHFNFYRGLLPDREFIDISPINRELRSVKSAWEIEQMRGSGRMLADAFRTIPGFLKPGMRELDLAAELEYRMRKAGIGGYLRIRGFNQELSGLAVSGPRATEPGCFDGPITGKGFWTAAPYGPSLDVIKENEPVVVDYGGFYNGYIVDMTRVFCIGRLDPGLERAFQVALDIEHWIMKNLVEGTVCEDLYAGALKMATDAGLGDDFMGPAGDQAKFVAHGIGLELDELPILAPRFKAPLVAGQTVAVEPKFVFPGKGAVGIENTFAVTAGACEKLTDLDDRILYL